MSVIVCFECNKGFEGEISRKYCSRECAKSAQSKQIAEYKKRIDPNRGLVWKCRCLVCGNKFEGQKGRKYCGQACGKLAQLEKLKQQTERRKLASQENAKSVFSKVCKICNVQFETNKLSRVYCGQACREQGAMQSFARSAEKHKKPPVVHTRVCLNCSTEFTTNNGTKRYCSEECRGTKSIPTYRSIASLRGDSKSIQLRGYYVYGWYDKNEELPFYIGKGTGARAWDAHEGLVCGRYKSSEVTVVIYRTRLTSEGALLLESVLMDVFRSLGAFLRNQTEGMNRVEVPPLEIPIDKFDDM